MRPGEGDIGKTTNNGEQTPTDQGDFSEPGSGAAIDDTNHDHLDAGAVELSAPLVTAHWLTERQARDRRP
jgi:hypothetical protein